MDSSNFRNDLRKEQYLTGYLDSLYSIILRQRGYTFERKHDMDSQHRGIDVEFSHNGKKIKVDEKAQLDYVGSDLPTFAFELSYLKNGQFRQGWLFDPSKETERYMLVTNISAESDDDITTGIRGVSLHYVDRFKLQEWLEKKGLDIRRIQELDRLTRMGNQVNKIIVPELNSFNEGNLFFSKFGKVERPINLVLRLQNLRELGIAERWAR